MKLGGYFAFSIITLGDAFTTPQIQFTTSKATSFQPKHGMHQQQHHKYLELRMSSGSGFFFDRLSRIVKSNVNKWVSATENPEKVILQAVDDMQTDLVKIRQAYAEATASQHRLHQQKQAADATASDWYDRAQLALRNNNEGLAKEALKRRQIAQEQVQTIRRENQMRQEAADKLHSAMVALEGKIREAASKKEQLVARARTAKSTQQVNDMLSGLTGKTSMDAFGRMEKKVEALEAAAQVAGEMTIIGGGQVKESSLEKEFLRLEQSYQVNQDLKDLKAMMMGSKSLPSSKNHSAEKPEVGSRSMSTIGESIHERVSIPVELRKEAFLQ